MRIVPKLTASLVAGMCLVLAVNGWFRVQRETVALEDERRARHRLVGRAISAAVATTWHSDGEAAALAMLRALAGWVPSFAGRWLPNKTDLPQHVASELVDRSPAGEPLTTVVRNGGVEEWYTYVTVEVDHQRTGVIELSERMVVADIRPVIMDTLKTASGLAILSALIAFALNQWLIGLPVRLLTDKARRIGRGDFTGLVNIASRDELALLGFEMNAMCNRLSATVEQLRHADRLATVGRVAAGVAHELGTPLNVVSARAAMIGRTSLEESREYARVIEAAAQRMAGTIQHLLHFARRRTGARAPHELGRLVRAAIDVLTPLAMKREVTVRVAVLPAVSVDVDGGQIQQVVTNLVMNAVQASEPGGTVSVRVDAADATPPPEIGGEPCTCVRVAVEDHGSGIAPEHLSQVFEPFFTTKQVGEGTGLGLAISYGIVRDHHGWIDIQSVLGQGTTFVLYLPVAGAGG